MRRALALASLLGLILACTAAPVQEMSDARQAIMAAQQIDMDGLHDEALIRARNRLRDAGDALHEHRFETARAAAIEAHREAVEVLRTHEAEGSEATEPPPPQ
jgi:hypothetical protein